MPAWAVGLAWYLIYMTSIWMIPNERLCKGFITKKVLRRVIPPRSMWNTGTSGHGYRYLIWLGFNFITLFVFHLRDIYWDALFWGVMIVLLMDDYIFGDDDRWKRLWEGGKNKVKWLMDLPATSEPQATPR